MNRNPALGFSALLVLLALTLGGLTWVNYRFSFVAPGGNDFLARWMGANQWLQEGLSPYDERVSLQTQEWIYGRPADVDAGEDKNHFVYPLYSMVFFGPFGMLDYPIARALWMTVLELSAVATVFVALRLAEWHPRLWLVAVLVLFSLLWYHGARTVIIGQFAGLNALLIVLSLYLIQQQKDVGAGILLALATSKPQMVFLLVPFVLLWGLSNRRSGILQGFFGALAAMLVVSLALIPDWPLRMLGQMLEYPTYTHIGSPISVFAASMPGIETQLSQALHVILYLYLLVQWTITLKKDERWFLWTALMTIVITNLTAFRTATTNYVMMIPVLLLVFRIWEQRWKSVGTGLVLTAVVAGTGGLWWLFLRTVEGNQESAAMYLPLPLFCLVTLWWVRWWSLRPRKLMLEEFAERMG